MSQIKPIKNPDYVNAFRDGFTTIWGGTPLANEVENLSYFRSFTCFLGTEEEDLKDRRKLVYEYLSNDFATALHTDTIVDLYNILPIEQSLTRIMRNLCTLYKQAPTRVFSSDTPIEWYDEADVNSAMKLAHHVAKLCNSALLMPVVRQGKMEIDVLPPDLFRVVSDPKDYKKITEIWIPYSEVNKYGEEVRYFKVWTDYDYSKRDLDGRVIEFEPNPYGRIPAVILQFSGARTDFYGGGMWELLLATLDDNKLKFLVDNDVVYSAFSVWIATNFGKSNVSIAPNRLIKVDSVINPDVGQLTPPSLESIAGNASFLSIEELRDIRYKRALRKEGLPESMISGDPSMAAASGVAMEIDRAELNELRIADEMIMRRFEREFYKLFAMVANKNLAAGLPIDGELSINYVDMPRYHDAATAAETNEKNFRAGYIGAKEFLSTIIDDDSIADDKAAIKYINDNLILLSTLGGSNGTDTANDTGETNQVQEQSQGSIVQSQP